MKIDWPNDSKYKTLLYLKFMIELFDYLNITFVDEEYDPLLIARSYLNGELTIEEYTNFFDLLSNMLEIKNLLLHEIKVWKLQLGRCLLSANLDLDDMDLKVEFLYECLNMYYLYKQQNFMYDKAIEFYKKWVI